MKQIIETQKLLHHERQNKTAFWCWRPQQKHPFSFTLVCLLLWILFKISKCLYLFWCWTEQKAERQMALQSWCQWLLRSWTPFLSFLTLLKPTAEGNMRIWFDWRPIQCLGSRLHVSLNEKRAACVVCTRVAINWQKGNLCYRQYI